MITEEELENFINYYLEEVHNSASSFIGVDNGNSNKGTK